MIRVILLGLFAVSSSAWGADVEVGVSLESGVDLPDPSSGEHTSFGLIPSLSVPVDFVLSDGLALRAAPRFTFATGTDRVLWDVPIDGVDSTFFADDQRAFLAAASLLFGPVVRTQLTDRFSLHFGAAAGPSWVGTYHSLTATSFILFDPDQNDLTDPSNLDPFTSQIVLSTDLFTGASVEIAESIKVNFELGYSSSFVGEKSLVRGLAELNPRRAAFGWNPLRAGVGVQFSL